MYLAGDFTTLPNLVFAGTFRLEVTIISLVVYDCCGDCSRTYPWSTIDDSGIVHLLVCQYFLPTDVCDETDMSNEGGVSTFLSKALGVGILGRLLKTDVSVFSVIYIVG